MNAPFTNVASASNAVARSNASISDLTSLVAELKTAAVNEISSCSDENTLRELRRVLGIVSDITTNQLSILGLYTSLNSITD